MKESVIELALKCSACARKVKAILQSIEGVQEVQVSVKDQFAIVKHDPQKVVVEDIEKVLRYAGYMLPLSKTPMFNYTEQKEAKSPLQQRLLKGKQDSTETVLKIAIEGMTCSSCSSTIENHLKSLPGVISVNVSLVLNTAQVTLEKRSISSSALLEEIEDIGFKGTILNGDENIRTGMFSVKGMSCAACVGTIERCLSALEGVESVEVSLLLNSARVTFDSSRVSTESLCQHVEDIGYEMSFQGYENAKDVVLNVRDSSLGEQQFNETKRYRDLLLFSCVFSIPIFIIAMVLSYVSGARQFLMTPVLNQLNVMGLLLWILCTPVQFYVGKMFYVSAYAAIRHGSANMAVLVAIGTSSAYLFSFLAVVMMALGKGKHVMGAEHYFETSSTLITFVLLGKFLESIAKQKTSQALSKLIDLQPSIARIVEMTETLEEETAERMVSVEKVKVDDILKVLRGEKIPLDGYIVKGSSSIEESMITGESMPQTKSTGDSVIGACINKENTIYVKVSRIGSDSTLSQIVKLMEHASMTKAPIQSYADYISSIFVPVVIAIALFTFIIWISLASTGSLPPRMLKDQSPLLFSLLFGIAVLTVACPCALGLATPTAVMVGTGVGARNGVLIKSGKALQIAHEIDTIIFDKTGTLTKGEPQVTDVRVTRAFQIKGMDDDSVIYLAASAERESEHPLARAIVSEAKTRSIQLANALNFNATTGKGLECEIAGRILLIGNRLWMSENKVSVDIVNEGVMQFLEDSGKTAICLAIDGRLAAVIGVADTLKPESASVVKYLQDKGISVLMVSGDNRRTAKAIGAQVGLEPDAIIAEALPQDKLEKVKFLQEKFNAKVAFIGDGINDSPALAQSDLGIAIGAGSDIAIEAADMVLMSESLLDVVKAFDLSKTTFRRIKWNFLWAMIFNTLGIPVAAGVFYPSFGVKLSPEFAALAMASSSLMVLSSSLLLNYYSPPQVVQRIEKKSYEVRQVSSERENWKTPLLSGQYQSSLSQSNDLEKSDCCACSECGLVSDNELQKLHEFLANQSSVDELSDQDISNLPNLSLCFCKCTDCKCTRLPHYAASALP